MDLRDLVKISSLDFSIFPMIASKSQSKKRIGGQLTWQNRCLCVIDAFYDMAIAHQQKTTDFKQLDIIIEINSKTIGDVDRSTIKIHAEGSTLEKYICTQTHLAKYKINGKSLRFQKGEFGQTLNIYLDRVLGLIHDFRPNPRSSVRDFELFFWHFPCKEYSEEVVDRIKQDNLNKLKEIWNPSIEQYRKKEIERKNHFGDGLNEEDDNENSASIHVTPQYPKGAIAPNSTFYVERGRVESLCFENIQNPGSLIRIKAPQLMGKTSLLNQVRSYSKQCGYSTVYLDFNSLEKRNLIELDRFLRWLCFKTSKALEIKTSVQESWDLEILALSSRRVIAKMLT